MKTLRLLALAAGLAAMGTIASAIPSCTAGTSDVTAGGFSCTLGNLTFSNFTVSPSSGFTAATIGITPSGSSSGTGQVGNDISLQFQFGGIQGTGSATDQGDILLTYVVTGGLTGIDINLQASPLLSGGNMQVFETACAVQFSGGSCPAPSGNTLANYAVVSTGNDVTNQENFASTGVVYIKKDIQFNGASDSELVNSHLTGVPEPMTFSLLGLGLLGVGFASRRLRK